MSYVTHFYDENRPGLTLCGQPWDGIVLNERPPTCEPCKDEHGQHGWTFPLPAVVT